MESQISNEQPEPKPDSDSEIADSQNKQEQDSEHNGFTKSPDAIPPENKDGISEPPKEPNQNETPLHPDEEDEKTEQPPQETTYSSKRDVIAPESKIEQLNVFNLYGQKAQSHINPKEIIEQFDISKWLLANELLDSDRKNYLERPGFNEALGSLSQSQRLLLLVGPEGCGLHASINALSYDLSKKILGEKNKIFSLPHLIQSSPDVLIRRFSLLEKSIVIFEDGIQTKQSFLVRLLGERDESGFEHVNDQLRNMGSWIIVSGLIEPPNKNARDLYDLFRRQKRLFELGMPNMANLFEKMVYQVGSNRATDLLRFISEKFPGGIDALRTSQDVEFFARRYYEIYTEETDPDQVVSKLTTVIRGITSIERDVRRLFEEELIDSDLDTLLAILLSVLNENLSSLFWGVFGYIKNSQIFEQEGNSATASDAPSEGKEEIKDKPQPQKTRRIFAPSRIAQLKRIHAEEVEKREIVDGEEVTVKIVRFIDERYAEEILRYSRSHYEDQISEICTLLEERFVQDERNVSIRMIMARAIARLSQSNWNGAFVPIISQWAVHPQQYVRASVGYALDQVLMENIYSGNVRFLLNKWATEPIGEYGWNIKWTVASACKQIGLRDITIGLEYLRKLATYLGQRDISKAKSTTELLSMIFDSQIESYMVYSAIQYTMVVYCMQGYIDQVMHELHEWSLESPDKNPLSFIATTLVLGILQEFGYLTMEAQKAGIENKWSSETLQEWSVQVYSTTMRKSYICNQILQYLMQNLNDKDLFETISIAMARTFAIAKLVNKHGLVYAILFQWVDELGQDVSNSILRETTFKIQKILLDICKNLGPDYIEEIRSQLTVASSSDDLSKPIQDFSKRVLRDLNAPSFRYSTRISR